MDFLSLDVTIRASPFSM